MEHPDGQQKHFVLTRRYTFATSGRSSQSNTHTDFLTVSFPHGETLVGRDPSSKEHAEASSVKLVCRRHSITAPSCSVYEVSSLRERSPQSSKADSGYETDIGSDKQATLINESTFGGGIDLDGVNAGLIDLKKVEDDESDWHLVPSQILEESQNCASKHWPWSVTWLKAQLVVGFMFGTKPCKESRVDDGKAFEPCDQDMPPQSTFELEIEESPLLFSLQDVRYIALPTQLYLPLRSNERPFPLTVVSLPKSGPWTREDVEPWLLPLDDDVMCIAFRQRVYLHSSADKDVELNSTLLEYLNGICARIVATPQMVNPCVITETLASGPHLWSNNRLHPVCRLYDDTSSAFLESLLPLSGPTCDFQKLGITGTLPRTLSVAVPTRKHMRSSGGTMNAVAGRRILVKDCFDMQGLRMSACNRAYYEMSKPAMQTSPLIQRLIDRGAHIVGTAKLSSMISREEPGESLDFEVPFNPRGDGYQSPAGSSSGCAAAIASYPWLDFAIGTDSTGSGRRPAFYNGCYSLRLSYRKEYLHGMMPCFPMFDAPAIFCRDIQILSQFVQEWLSPDLIKRQPRIKREYLEVIVLEDYPTNDNIDHPMNDTPDQGALVDSFLSDAEACSSVEVYRRVNIRQSWRRNPPTGAKGERDMYRFLKDVGKTAFFFDFYHASDSFRSAYEKKNNHRPAVNKVTAFRWEKAEGDHILSQQRNEAVDRWNVFGAWLDQLLFKGNRDAVVLLPVARAGKNDRDSPPSQPFVQEAWDPLLLAPILGAPEITLPIGQLPYVSEFTKSKILLPVGISLMGAPTCPPGQPVANRPGAEIALIEAAEILLACTKRPTKVDTGPKTFA